MIDNQPITDSDSISVSSDERPQRPRAVTQKQIADRLGVTQQLVALALKGNPNVAETTKQKVLAVAKELGYIANRPARAMAAARHGTRVKNDVLAVIFDVKPHIPTITAPYFMLFVDGIELEAGAHQIDLFLVRRKPTTLPWLISEGLVDGVVLLGSHNSAAEIAELGVPVMTLGSYSPGVSGIAPDDEAGTRAITNHLIELGHTRIAYLGPDLDWRSARKRVQGYQNALRAAGLPVDEELLETSVAEPLEPYGREAMTRLLKRTNFTAVICHNDPVAMGAIRVAQEHGLHVPRDLSVAGFDDVSEAAGFSPTITSVFFPSIEMGRAAVKMLLEDTSEIRHEEFPVELHIRQSTARCPT